MNNVLQFTVTHKVGSTDCIKCGYMILITEGFERDRKRDHKSFYCTSCGQSQHWPGKSDIEKLRDELTQEQRRSQWARDNAANERKAREDTERRLAAQKGQNTKLRNRVSHGVCPCCNRSFENLRRHMASQHPDFGGEQS